MIRFILRGIAVLVISMTVLSVNGAEPMKHTVQRGETVESIAHHYKVTTEQIFAVNPLARQSFFVGMKLTIPASDGKSVGTPPQNTSADNPGTGEAAILRTEEKQVKPVTNGHCDDSFAGYGVSATFPFKDFMQNGCMLDVQGILTEEKWSHFGGYFSVGWSLSWRDSFKIETVNFSFGPAYSIPVAANIRFVVQGGPVLSLSLTNEENPDTGKKKDKWHTTWCGMLSPMVVYKKFGIGVTALFGKGDPTFGLKLAVIGI